MPTRVSRYRHDLLSAFGHDESAGPRDKGHGSFYTPVPVVRALVRWAVRRRSDRLLDPACGDGRFLRAHPNGVGIDQDVEASAGWVGRSADVALHHADFFHWAGSTTERFDCAAGNPPFIRYQRFSGVARETAVGYCRRHGASFSGLSSSWPLFLVAAATLLKPGGRMAFVVPAEIGHAPYAAPLLAFLAERFDRVNLVPVCDKLFPDLSEDCWLLFTEGYGGGTSHFHLSPVDQFDRPGQDRTVARPSRSPTGEPGTAD